METEQLALLGGPKAIQEEFSPYRSIGEEERMAVDQVMRSGTLSKFLGAWHEDFYGGTNVKSFESMWAEYFGAKHAVSVNSWTSGLIAAIGAIGIEPGDEVIVSPWTMCASATAILHWNAIPVFADIEPDTFNLDPVSVEANITEYTRAIVAVDIFGHSAEMFSLREIADRYGLKIISDTAQAPGAEYDGKYAGTLADIGGYSLNYHKHIHTGEGGMLVTEDDEFAERLKLIRNHAEAVVGDMGRVTSLSNMIGYNFRLGEIESAIGIEQLKKLKPLIRSRQTIANQLSEGLTDLEGLTLPVTHQHCSHVYYIYALKLNSEVAGISKQQLIAALAAEGVNLAGGYQNLHLLPMYQKKIAYGSNGFPWSSDFCKRDVSYDKGICPVAERLHDSEYMGFGLCEYELTQTNVEQIVNAFRKTWSRRSELAARVSV